MPIRTLLAQIATAQRAGGKPAARQMLDLLRLRLRTPPIGIGEYFDYGMWRRGVTDEQLSDYIGWRESGQLDRRLNDDHSRALANDKLLTYLVLAAAGLPIPRPLATYTTNGRRIADEQTLTRPEEVEAYLASPIYPCYVKPIAGGYGKGVLGLAGRTGDALQLLDGSTLAGDEWRRSFAFPPYRGMLFQAPLHAHPHIQELTGTSAVCCVRFICLVTERGASVHTAFWKIAAGRNMLDNFSHGDYGNCLGALDVGTGTVTHAISKLGIGGAIERHPTTQRRLIGFQLPDWQAAIDRVIAAATHFPGLRLQNWDVALCPQGPVLLELNTESELNVPQAISGRGFMTPVLRAQLAAIAEERAAFQRSMALRSQVR